MNLYAIGAAAVVCLGLAAGLLYYKAEEAERRVEITDLKADVQRLEADKIALKASAEKAKLMVDTYITSLDEMSNRNMELNSEVQHLQSKMAKHRLLKLRNSRHSELTLKIINRSVDKMHNKWQKE